MDAMVYWITGLSGAGKTTIGKLLYKKIKEKWSNTVFLDGDMLRKVFGDDLGYSKEEPKSPDLVLTNDGERTPKELAEEIIFRLGFVK